VHDVHLPNIPLNFFAIMSLILILIFIVDFIFDLFVPP
jgi:hypothetical protein